MEQTKRTKVFTTFKISSVPVAVKITTIYLIFGFLWILFSDSIVLMFVKDVNELSQLQTAKGWFYVLITAIFLFILIHYYFQIIENGKTELQQSYDATLEGWARALDLRDKETEGHTKRVTELAQKLAKNLGLEEVELENIRRGALLHDIGKMAIPDQILRKPGPLDDEEWDEMRKHPIYSWELLSPILYLRNSLDIPRYHHEKWDGSGYPMGLAKENIPLAARIFAVVDVYDALCTDRPYRKGWPMDKVLGYIQEQSGIHFDPQIANCFLEMMGHR